MRRERSAGGLVVRHADGRPTLAVIRPQGKPPGTWALPKGHIEPGEDPAAAAIRETREETGLRTRVVRALGETRYTYRFDGRPVAKTVAFFLLEPVGGSLGDLAPGMEREVADVAWLDLAEAAERLAYPGERALVAEVLAADDL